METLKAKLCSAPCLALPNTENEFHLEVSYSKHCLSAGLHQMYDWDKHVVAHATNMLTDPELNSSDCENAFLATVWVFKHFSN